MHAVAGVGLLSALLKCAVCGHRSEACCTWLDTFDLCLCSFLMQHTLTAALSCYMNIAVYVCMSAHAGMVINAALGVLFLPAGSGHLFLHVPAIIYLSSPQQLPVFTA
jgi:hypothetical protein